MSPSHSALGCPSTGFILNGIGLLLRFYIVHFFVVTLLNINLIVYN